MEFGFKKLNLNYGKNSLSEKIKINFSLSKWNKKFEKSKFVKLVSLIIVILSLDLKAIAQSQDIKDQDEMQNEVLESIQCRGNLATECAYISSFININPGDKITDDEITNSKLRLSSLTNFESVHLLIEKGSERGKVSLVVEVQEANPFSKEFLYGISYNRYFNNTFSNNLAARVSHNNLFGNGKILDFEANLQSFSLNDYTDNSNKKNKFYLYSMRSQYVDPNLFGLKNVFFIAGLEGESSKYGFKNSYINESIFADISLGYRFASFSYLRFIYKDNFYKKDNLFIENIEYSRRGFNKNYKIGINYGWNSEDDNYFPNQGSKFNLNFGWQYDRFLDDTMTSSYFYLDQFSYQINWSGDNNSVWSFKYGGTPDSRYRESFEEGQSLALTYAKPILSNEFSLSSIFGKIEKGRWYVEPSMTGPAYSSYNGFIIDPGIKVGVRLQSKSLGIIDLYAFYKTDYRLGGQK